VEFSLCLLFAKLVSYTFLYWLPLYIVNVGEVLEMAEQSGVDSAPSSLGSSPPSSSCSSFWCQGSWRPVHPLRRWWYFRFVVRLGAGLHQSLGTILGLSLRLTFPLEKISLGVQSCVWVQGNHAQGGRQLMDK